MPPRPPPTVLCPSPKALAHSRPALHPARPNHLGLHTDRRCRPGPPRQRGRQVPHRRPRASLASWRAVSSVRDEKQLCTALEWAEWRTSPELGGPQANQERLSRYKASQSGSGAPVPHSLPSQIVTMGTITKKDSSQMQSFPGKFLPFSPTFSSLHTPSSP